MVRPKKDGRLKRNRDKKSNEEVSDKTNQDDTPNPDALSAGHTTSHQNSSTTLHMATPIPPSGDENEKVTTDLQVDMPPPPIPKKKSRKSLPTIDDTSDSFCQLGLLTPPTRRITRRSAIPFTEPMEIDDSVSIAQSSSSTRSSSRLSRNRISSTSTTSSVTSHDLVPEERPELWNSFEFANLAEIINANRGQIPDEFREKSAFFDEWTPIVDLINPLNLDEEGMRSIRIPRQKLYDQVVFQYLVSFTWNSIDTNIAVIHPIISSFFEPNRPGLGLYAGMENARLNASELTYGHRRDFAIILIPIHQIVNDHWTLIIYDIRAKMFLFFDPLHSDPLQWHKDLATHVRNTVLPRKKLKGSFRAAPKGSYPSQRGSYECGHHICRIAERYVFNEQNLDEPDFNPELFRREILQTVEVIYQNSIEYNPIPVDAVAQNIDKDDSDNESIATANSIKTTATSISIRTSSRIASRNSITNTPNRVISAPKSESLRLSNYRKNLAVCKTNESRRKVLYDQSKIDNSMCEGDIEYEPNEALARHSLEYYPVPYFSGKFEKICPFCTARLLENEDFRICCNHGRIVLPLYAVEKKGYLAELHDRMHPHHKHFIDNTKPYNNSLAFCSITNHHFATNERYYGHKNLIIVNGELRFGIADLDAPLGKDPAFAQLYTIEPDMSKEYRARNPFFSKSNCKIEIISLLEADIRKYNSIAHAYKNAREIYEEERTKLVEEARNQDDELHPHLVVPRFRLILLEQRDVPMNARVPGHHPGTLSMPTNNQIHIAWTSSEGEPPKNIGTWVVNNTGHIRYLPVWSANLDPLAYPLIFQEGEQGYRKEFKLENKKKPPPKARKSKSKAPKLIIDSISDTSSDEQNSIDLPWDVRIEDPCGANDDQDQNVNDEFPDLVEDNAVQEDDSSESTEEVDIGDEVDVVTGKCGKREFVSRRQFDRFHYMRRGPIKTPINLIPHHLFSLKSLAQAFVIDHRLRQECLDLDYYKKVQERYRHANEDELRTQLSKRLETGQVLGKLFLNPRKLPGNSRYYQHKYKDASAIYDQVGPPNFFLTFTMNPRLPEVQESLYDGFSYLHGFDIVSRIFQDRVNELIKDINERKRLGEAVYLIGSREWQKRGLTHCHFVIKIHPHKYRETPEFVDDFISAEIPELSKPGDAPDKVDKLKKLRELVLAYQVHKCNEKSQCWDKDKGCCTKGYPKPYSEVTDISSRFPKYRRRAPVGNLHVGIKKERGKNVNVTNADIVPYNKYLLLKYQQHHDLEFIRGKESVNYCIKYLLKGNDKLYVTVTKSKDKEGNQVVDYDEPRHYRLTRVMGPNEAFDKTMGYPTIYSTFSVELLPLHLPKKSNVVFPADAEVEELQEKIEHVDTKLSAFLKQCREEHELIQQGMCPEPLFQDLFYHDLPKKFVWNAQAKRWTKRKQRWNKLGRIPSVSPQNREAYALRILLKHTKCPGKNSTPEDPFLGLKTVDGVIYENFYDAAHARGLIASAKTWEDALHDVIVISKSAWRVRHYFARMIVHCGDGPHVSDLWNKFMDNMISPPLASYPDTNSALSHRIQSEDFARKHLYYLVWRFCNRPLSDFGINVDDLDLSDIDQFDRIPQFPNEQVVIQDDNFHLDISQDRLITDDERRDIEEQAERLDGQQKEAFTAVIQAVQRNIHPNANRLIFIQGNAGTGKTYLIKLLDKYIRFILNKDVIFCAPTGMAATLLPEGRTAHTTFGLPTKNLSQVPQMVHDDPRAERIKSANVIFIDEVVILHKQHFAHIDVLLRDLMKNDAPFGKKVVVISGDFQQNLPVVKHAPASASVEACIKRSPLYQLFSKFYLTENRRALPDERELVELLNRIGSGIDIDPETNSTTVPSSIVVHSEKELRDWLFDGNSLQDCNQIKDRCSLAPKNKDVFADNHSILQKFVGGQNDKTYELFATNVTVESEDSVLEQDVDMWNSIEDSSLPPNRLRLKIGCIVMLIRNISVQDGLTNGTRLEVISVLEPHLVVCRVITGNSQGLIIEFPPYCFEYEDEIQPLIHFKRYQFPFRLSFSMTITKAQGQGFPKVGINLKEDVFAHGQLYVALSRATTLEGVKIFVPKNRIPSKPTDSPNTVRVRNIVIKDIIGL